MSYGFCYVIVFITAVVSYTDSDSNTHSLFSVHIVCSRAYSSTGYSHCSFILKVIFVIFLSIETNTLLNANFSKYCFIKSRKIITNTSNTQLCNTSMDSVLYFVRSLQYFFVPSLLIVISISLLVCNNSELVG